MPDIALVYRTPEDLQILQGVVGRSPAVTIPASGEPLLGAVMYRGVTRKQHQRLLATYRTNPNFAHQTVKEQLKASLLVELLKRQETGTYHRPEKSPQPSGERVLFLNEWGKQAKDTDSAAALRYMRERGLEYNFRAVRRAFGPGVVEVVKSHALYEGTDYYYFGFRTEAEVQAAWTRMNDYQDQIEHQTANKPWVLFVAGLQRSGRRRWLLLAAGAFIHSEYAITVAEGKELGAAAFRSDTREEARTAALQIRSAAEFKPEMKLVLRSPSGEREETGTEVTE